MAKLTTIIFILISFNLIAQSNDQTYIEVIGESEIEIIPDIIELTIIIRETENIKKENELLERELKMMNTLKEFSIVDSDIAIDKIAGYRFGYYKTGSKYQLSKVYKVQVRKTGVIDNLIIKMFESGVNDVKITRLINNDMESFKIKASIEAISNAKKRAEQIANSLDVSIGKAIQIKELLPIDFNGKVDSDNNFFKAQGIDFERSSTQNLNIKQILLTYRVSVRFQIN